MIQHGDLYKLQAVNRGRRGSTWTTCMRSPKDASWAGAQPDDDWPNRPDSSLLAWRGHSITCDTVVDASIDLGRSPKRDLLKRFDILHPVAYLIAQLEKQRPGRFGAPAFQRGLTDSPALSQLGLGHASFGHHVRPFAGFFGTEMKALFAGKAKLVGRFKDGGLL